MRVFVFLLVLVNLLFAAWSQGYLGMTESPDAQRVSQQLNAERLAIVARDEPPPLRSDKAVRADKAALKASVEEDGKGDSGKGMPELCLQVNDVPSEAAQTVVELFSQKLPSFRVQRTTHAANAGFWVFIPPLATKKEAEIKAAELKRLGVPEFFIVQDGAQARAISLGVFSTRDAANARLEQLRSKGVRSAKIGERPAKATSYDLQINGPESSGEGARRLLGERLPEHPLSSCKAVP